MYDHAVSVTLIHALGYLTLTPHTLSLGDLTFSVRLAFLLYAWHSMPYTHHCKYPSKKWRSPEFKPLRIISFVSRTAHWTKLECNLKWLWCRIVIEGFPLRLSLNSVPIISRVNISTHWFNDARESVLYLLFDLLKRVALLPDVMEEVQSFVVLLWHLHTSLFQTALQTLKPRRTNVQPVDHLLVNKVQ